MSDPLVSHDAPPVRGFAWHVYPDPATPGVFDGDVPFGDELPADVGPFWLVGKSTPGLHNLHQGHSYLVLTSSKQPPEVTAGWTAEPAAIGENFELDQRGDRWVRLVRIIETFDTPSGRLHDCEFQVDRA